MKEFQVKERFIELRAQGWSYDRISTNLNVSKQTLIDWSRNLNQEISNLKTIELDALREKYRLHRFARLETFGKVLERITSELESRDLSTVPTEKLILLLLRTQEALSHEASVLNFKGKKNDVEEIAQTLSPYTDIEWAAE